MYMFKPFFEYLPKNRYDYVSDLRPEDVSLPPYIPKDCDDDLSLSGSSDSLDSIFDDVDDLRERRPSLDTDSSIALSRAMTDSDVDYEEYYRKLKTRNREDPWSDLKTVQDNFPLDYLESLRSFQTSDSETWTQSKDFEKWKRSQLVLHEELRARMKRFFDEECCVFDSDDSGLEILMKALKNVELEELNLDSSI